MVTGVSLGYFNNKALTAEKFINNPFGSGMVYKTGDSVKWLPDGNIEFLGRIDNQVKIRGFRVELNEINNRIMNIDNVKTCATIIKATDGKKIICSYFTSKDGASIEEAFIKEVLKEYLPSYMLPSFICQMEALPINANGKIDKNALPEPVLSTSREVLKPQNAIQEELLSIFKRVLGLNEISITDNFFELRW